MTTYIDTVIKSVGGTTALLLAYLGYSRQILVDTDLATLRVFDGVKLGGYPLGKREIPQTIVTANYTGILSDAGKHFLHPTSDNNARTITIPANSSVPYDIGTTLLFFNQVKTVTIAITSDTMYKSGNGVTGSRTLAAWGTAVATKITATSWIISGVGLT